MLANGLHPNYRQIDAADWRWPHFEPVELACKCGGKRCGGEYVHDAAFMDALEALRVAVGRPFRINSGRRCPGHNRAVGGARFSRHTVAGEGGGPSIAVDIYVGDWPDEAKRAILLGARRLGFGGIGYGLRFLHLDRRALKPGGKPAEWDYQKGGMAQWKALL